jgi:hypothetical protein
MRSAKALRWTNCAIGSPSLDSRGGSPGRRIVASPSHRFGRPPTQYSHVPQKADRHPMTWSPGATWDTAVPTASTTPAGSCPRTIGTGFGSAPSSTCRSL